MKSPHEKALKSKGDKDTMPSYSPEYYRTHKSAIKKSWAWHKRNSDAPSV